MPKKEILIVAGILLLAVVSLAAYRLLGRGKTATGKINVYVNGALYASEPLRPGQTLTVTQQDGSTNVIRMTEGGFYMESSTCHNQLCVQQGEVTRDNWSRRALGAHILCLPNRVDAELEVEAAASPVEAPDA